MTTLSIKGYYVTFRTMTLSIILCHYAECRDLFFAVVIVTILSVMASPLRLDVFCRLQKADKRQG
jgi:hypothetical protein